MTVGGLVHMLPGSYYLTLIVIEKIVAERVSQNCSVRELIDLSKLICIRDSFAWLLFAISSM